MQENVFLQNIKKYFKTFFNQTKWEHLTKIFKSTKNCTSCPYPAIYLHFYLS